jgi:hypothetical protein
MRVHRDPPRFFAPAFIVCLDCEGFMRLGSITPAAAGHDEIMYRCEECATERKQLVRAKAW